MPEYRGSEPLDIDTIGDALVIKEGNIFLFTDGEGEVRPAAQAGYGLYCDDTRYLSRYQLLLNGQEPVALLSTAENGYSEQVFTNRQIKGKRGRMTPKQTLEVRRLRVISRGLVETLDISNHGYEPIMIRLELQFACDFEDIFAVRGLDYEARGQADTPLQGPNWVEFGYRSLDSRFLSLRITFSDPPDQLSTEAAAFEFELAPQRIHRIEVKISLNGEAINEWPTIHQLRLAQEDWRSSGTHVTGDNRFFQQAFDRSMDDIRMLMRFSNGNAALSAGVPWFDALFGRDSAIAALQLLPYHPEIARGTLRLLAQYQSTEINPKREAQPGKIIHEMRDGELSRTEQVPFGYYFGSVDSTPLFLTLYEQYLTWTNDVALAEEIAPNVEAAVRWIEEWGDMDGDGYVEYASLSEEGLLNQGWKDSDDGIIDAEGNFPSPPIALVEVQAYVYAAYKGLARIEKALGRRRQASNFQRKAQALQAKFRQDFYLRRERFLALGLDGNKQPITTVASNAGHALWAGILDQERADRVAHRLFRGDLFSGWGIRTLSTNSPRYNPVGYHLGTIWPHDNSIIAMGLKRYGHVEDLVKLATALFEAACSFPYFRLPELFCGHQRLEHGPPVPYPIACRPQAWAAGSLPYMLQAMLGLLADAPNKRLFLVRPHLPPWLESVLFENLRVGNETTNLLVRGRGDLVDVKVIGGSRTNIEVVTDWPFNY